MACLSRSRSSSIFPVPFAGQTISELRNYGDCVRKIAQFNYIPKPLESQLLSMIGLRNLLVHEYAIIEPDRLYDFIGDLSIFRDFITCVRDLA